MYIKHYRDNLKITILSGVQGDTRRYRSFHLFEQLHLVENGCILEHVSSNTAQASAINADILILQRILWDRYSSRSIYKARSHNAIILYDLDDLVFLRESFSWIDSPDFSDQIRATLYQENLERNRQAIEECEGVITSTDYLAQQVQQQFNKNVWVHRNAFSLEMFYRSQEALRFITPHSNEVIIGYASGTPTHDRDFALVQSILKKLLEEYPHLHLHLIGYINNKFDWGKVSQKVRYFKFVPWRELPKLLAQFSINIAPLRLDNPFSQSKSELKYVEAALVKVPTIASPTDAFRFAIRQGENGFLAQVADDWEKSLRELIENPELRIKTGGNAYQDVMERYSPWVRAEEAVKLLNSITQTLRPNWELLPELQIQPILNPKDYQHLWISPDLEKHPTLLERGLYTLHTRGMMILLKEIWIFLRRLFSPIFPFKAKGDIENTST
ncbi:MAG: glycosyltransferase family 4 protein [Anaerolineales bacterium]